MVGFVDYRKGAKKDFSSAILERMMAANRLVVDESINDDNLVVALHPDTMEKLQLFRGDTILIKVLERLKQNRDMLFTEVKCLNFLLYSPLPLITN
ncbi:hypothetical protein Syun_015384 [Stephania yunnanensis]|uniref:Uncharacterized protein n=1 Tax=Stephania yunnanensis TaxID=152371 RepID=A0AAP0JLK7_9MAGN